MRTLLAIGGPLDGQAITFRDEVSRVVVAGADGEYIRERASARVEVLTYRAPTAAVVAPDRWTARKRNAYFGVDRKPFAR